jgi:hypothetical protein
VPSMRTTSHSALLDALNMTSFPTSLRS